MKELRIENLKVTYTEKKSKSIIIGLNDFSYSFKENSFTAIIGPSGSGKTTLLKALINRVDYDSGYIYLDDVDADSIPLSQRNFSYISQDVVLYKTKTVFDNLAFPIKKKGVKRDDIRQKVYEISEQIGIDNILDRKVTYLSKGQQQLVNFAKALIKNPSVILMDEPFSNIDPINKLILKKFLVEYRKTHNVIILFVTHEEKDASQLADEVIFLNDGCIEKSGLCKNLLKAEMSLEKEEKNLKVTNDKKYKDPVTRKVQFFDILRNRLVTISIIGGLILLFSTLLFFILVVKQRVLEPTLYKQLMIEQGYLEKDIPTLYVYSTLIYDAIEIPCIMVSALGFAGAFRVIRRLIWNEGTFVIHDFFSGIKLYWKKFLIVGAIIGIFLTIINYVVGILSLNVSANLAVGVEIAFKVLFAVMVLPIIAIMLIDDTYFKLTFKNNFQNATNLYVRGLIIYLLLALLFAPLLFISLIQNFYLLLIVVALAFVIYIPMLLIAWHSYTNYMFDEYVDFPDQSYVKKGLFKVKTSKN